MADARLVSEQPVLAGYIKQMRAAHNPADCRRLQLDLIDAVRGLQDGMDDLRAAQKLATAEIGALSVDRVVNRAQLVAAQQHLDELKRQERLANALRHAFLAVGDGIAWRIPRFRSRGGNCPCAWQSRRQVRERRRV
ncbi:MAG: hypothetical protein ACLP0J_11565 [Solirubrobacteraceae bacterium]